MERFAGRYALLRPLGRGGMGQVWLALDLTTGNECALKRLDLRLAHAERDSLRGEFEVLTRVRHPVVVSVHELGFAPDGTPFYTMEYVPGRPADQALAGAGWPALYDVAARVTDGLEALHAAGIVHGDVKPSNLLVLPGSGPAAAPLGVRLVDFGLAALLERERKGHRGTPGFAAPEVVRGTPLSPATDLYGLGATLCVLALRVARGDEHPGAKPVPPPASGTAARVALAEASVPHGLARLIVRLLSSAPESRPAGAGEVRLELARLHPAARRTWDERLDTELLIGRGRELARLERWLATSPAPPLLMLTGEPGIGKSTLLRALAARAALAGRTVVALACAPGDAPGVAARTLLLRLAAGAEALAGTSPSHAATRARLEQPEPLRADELAALAAAAMAWAQAIRDRTAPVLVLIDDHPHLDELSRALVRRLVAEEPRDMFRWLWSSALAADAAESMEPLWREAGIAEAMPLGLLPREHADALLAARLQSPPPAELAEAIWTRCGGHPGLSVEVLRIAARADVLRETANGLTLDRAALGRLSLPADFEAASLLRLDALPAAARAAAAALAVWAAPVPPALVVALEPAADASALASLRESGLLTGDDAGRCALNPPALARAVLGALPEPERVRLHRAALEQPALPVAVRFRLWHGAGEPRRALGELEAAPGLADEPRLAVEAAALASAAVPEQAALWEARAGELLIRRGRYRDALPHLALAVAQAPDDPACPRRTFLLSSAYLRTGALAELDALLTRALAGTLPDAVRALLTVNRSAQRIAEGDFAAAERLTAEALALAQASGDGEAEGLALHAMASQLSLDSDGVAAQEFARRSADAYARAGHEVGRLRASVMLARALWAQLQHEPAERLCREALAAASRADLRLPMWDILRVLSSFMVEAGAWAEARALEEQALRLALEEGWPALAATSLFGRLILDALTGRTARALREAPNTLRFVRRHQPYMEAATVRAIATLLRTSGRTRRAARACRRAIVLAERLGAPLELQWSRIEYGHLLARANRWPQARELWLAGWAEHPVADTIASCILSLLVARAELRQGHASEAERRLQQVETWLQRQRAPYVRAQALQLRAELQLVHAEPTGAAAAVAAALDAFDALPMPADTGAAAVEFARLAHASGLAARVPLADWLHRAVAACELVGDRPGRERALALAVENYRRFALGAAPVARERDLLKAVGRLLDSLSDLGQLTRAAMRLAVEQLDAERGVLLLARRDAVAPPGAAPGPGDEDLQPVVEHGAVDAATRDQALTYSRQAVKRVRRSGGSLVIPDAHSEAEALTHSVVELGLRSILCVPLFVESRVVGAVYLDSRRPEAFGDAERALLEGFAHLLAVAIENSRGHEAVRLANEQLVGENLSLRREAGVRFRPQNFIGGSLAMQRVLATVERAAVTTSSVLITGENGTGKELIARMLHHSGPRALKPFVAVNCAALVGSLLESELFGILPDVATGVRGRAGRFVEADGGTLFLDEIGDMPVSQQVALLRALATGTVTPVGGGRALPVDVRIIAATNRDLVRGIQEGTFREDLWYRLNVIPIEMPALRDRKADIPSLAQHFAAVFAGQQERDVPTLAPGLIAVLMQSDWAGNVRELQNYIERLMAMTPGKVLHPDPLPNDLRHRAQVAGRGERGRSLEELVAELEKRHVLEALDRNAGNQVRAARELGLTEQSLRYRLRKYALHQARRLRRVR